MLLQLGSGGLRGGLVITVLGGIALAASFWLMLAGVSPC